VKAFQDLKETSSWKKKKKEKKKIQLG